MARPKKKIERDQFEKLCALQCTLIEIASYFNCSEDTIENWCKKEYERGFSEVFRTKRTNGHISLRRNQFRLAENNATMAIWLGKQYLGQTDKTEISLHTDDDTINEMEEYFKRKKNEEK